MAVKVSVLGTPSHHGLPSTEDDLLLRCLSLVTDDTVSLVVPQVADLVVVYPYRFPLKSTLAGAVFESGTRFLDRLPHGASAESLLRRLYRIPRGTPILAVSHENLDRRPWQVFGSLIREAGIPRLTFWPSDVDPDGFRFPYWWNYINWPEIPRPKAGAGSRFGQLYELSQLCEPMSTKASLEGRYAKAVWVTGHLEFPRDGILRTLSRYVDVEILQGVPYGDKSAVLRSYAYCVTTENSTGYGYETEKVPEAIMSGCIPIGYIQNPYSDFNPNSLYFVPPRHIPELMPALLTAEPSLGGLLNYLRGVLRP